MNQPLLLGLEDLAENSTLDIISCDLDNNNLAEHIVISTIDVKTTDNEPNTLKASSSVSLYDNNYSKIASLVNLENGFWGGVKTEANKIFISKDNIYLVDIDNDNLMEILICLPTYEGTEVSILKYSNGEILGTTNIEASVEKQ